MTTRGPGDFTPVPPPTSEVPEAEPAPERETVVPHPNVAGGLDNIPEDMLASDEQLQDELDHAGMDAVLPGEDRAPGEPVPEDRKHKH
jgi:hypothetical protein